MTFADNRKQHIYQAAELEGLRLGELIAQVVVGIVTEGQHHSAAEPKESFLLVGFRADNDDCLRRIGIQDLPDERRRVHVFDASQFS